MPLQTKSSVAAFVREDTEGVLKDPSAAEFSALREGFSFSGALETVESDELIDDIGASKAFTTKETPSASIPHYFKHSGVEGQEPDYGILMESAMAGKTVFATEYNTIAGSTAGDQSSRASINVDVGEGAQFEKGQALLFKDSANGFYIRNVFEISGDSFTTNFNLDAAPAAGVDLGKAVLYRPESTGHPTFSAHHYQASSSSGFHQAIAGCRTTSMAIEFPANDLAQINFDFEGISYYYNPIQITAGSNDKIDYTDSVSTKQAVIQPRIYKTPKELERAVEAAFAGSADSISVFYDSLTGLFTISSDNATFSLLWDTGAGSAESAGATLGFDTGADDTGAQSYTSDNEQSYDPPVTPAFDDQTPTVVKNNELLLGDFFRIDCRKGSNVSITVATPKTDVDDFCAESGVSESVTLERSATLSATLLLNKHEVDEFDKLLNNTNSPVMFNHGPKSGGNWQPGKCVNVYMPNATITANTVAEADGIFVVELEASAYVDASQKDIYINLL